MRSRRGIGIAGAAALALTAMLAMAQSPAQPQAGGTGAAAAAAGPAPAYSYNPEGRRDPFLSLLRRGTDVGRPQGKPAEGIAGVYVNDLMVRGILQSRGQFIALVQGPDNRTYMVRPNDRLADGIVRAITPDALVLLQDVNDPLSPTRQREVRKPLRATVEQK